MTEPEQTWHIVRNERRYGNHAQAKHPGYVEEYVTVNGIPLPVLSNVPENGVWLSFGAWEQISEERAQELAQAIWQSDGALGAAETARLMEMVADAAE